jgi:hypothetical protein
VVITVAWGRGVVNQVVLLRRWMASCSFVFVIPVSFGCQLEEKIFSLQYNVDINLFPTWIACLQAVIMRRNPTHAIHAAHARGAQNAQHAGMIAVALPFLPFNWLFNPSYFPTLFYLRTQCAFNAAFIAH